jgi:PAS domain S-box-containing protein
MTATASSSGPGTVTLPASGADRRAALVLRAAGVGVVYFAAAKAGLALAVVNASATAVWPPTGIAIASVLLLGWGVWPGILAGAFAANLTTSGHLGSSLGIAVGNTLEALVAGWLTRRFASGTKMLERPADVFRFALLGGLISPLISVAIGIGSLAAGGLAARRDMASVALTWWLGDVGGALVVTPLILAWAARPRLTWSPRRTFEAIAVLLALGFSAAVVFGGLFGPHRGTPLTFLCFPALVWFAFRFGVRESATATALLTLAATLGTVHGFGPFARSDPNESLLLQQAFLAVISVMMLAVAASNGERDGYASRMGQLNEQLERRVQERTSQLASANEGLRAEVRERARAESLLRVGELRLREAQRVAQVGSWEWDILRDEVWWSDELYRIYGLDPTSFHVSYDAFLSRVVPEDRDMVRQSVSESLRTGQPYAAEYRIHRKDGVILTVQAQGQVQADEGGQPVRMFGVCQDVTDRKRAESARAQLAHEQVARREAEEAHRLKDQFLAALSHELRTPLNAIVGWTHLLQAGDLEVEERRKALDAIARNAQLQSRLVSDVLDISRLISGSVQLDLKPVRVSDVLDRALATATPAAQAKGIRLLTLVNPGAPPVMADARRLEQMLDHLLSNAVKFARERGQVLVAVESHDRTLSLRVEDDGPGIAPDFLPHVFDRLRQTDVRHWRRQGGLGIGLAIVRALVELHGGTVTAANGAERGAVFTVTLPTTSALELPPPPAAAATEAPDGPPSLEGLNVLVVEDDPDSRDVVVLEMTRAGARTGGAGSAAEALRALDAEPYDVMISDIAMPGQDGYELMAQIRRRPKDRNGRVPAIALTAFTDDASVASLLAVGYQAHLAKPVSLDALVRLVARLAQARLNGD